MYAKTYQESKPVLKPKKQKSKIERNSRWDNHFNKEKKQAEHNKNKSASPHLKPKSKSLSKSRSPSVDLNNIQKPHRTKKLKAKLGTLSISGKMSNSNCRKTSADRALNKSTTNSLFTREHQEDDLRQSSLVFNRSTSNHVWKIQSRQQPLNSTAKFNLDQIPKGDD